MKNVRSIKNIILLIGVFIITLVCIALVFASNMKSIRLKNKTKELVNYINKLDSGEYYYKTGVLYNENNEVISTDYYINGTGNIVKDEYNNVKLSIEIDDRCAYKTTLGKVKVQKKCGIVPLMVNSNKNNSQVSFTIDNDINAYMLTRSNKMDGEWIKNKDKSLILNLFEEGSYYIWFKDSDGNLSNTIKFSINCLKAENADFSKYTLYCSGSTIKIKDEGWIVISDKNRELSIMKQESLDKKFSHTTGDEEYRWSKSLINKYLNNEYYDTINEELKPLIIEKEICDEPSGKTGCDSGDGCGGYSKETIEKYKWSCNKYTKSKVRLISYDEYSLIYDNITERSLIYGSYWIINSYKINKTGLSISPNGDVFVGETTSNELEIRPVITINR